jgi:hypothetical protein
MEAVSPGGSENVAVPPAWYVPATEFAGQSQHDDAHTPLAQDTPPQQSASVAQLPPAALQAQAALEQVPLQHPSVASQGAPTGRQAALLQLPPGTSMKSSGWFACPSTQPASDVLINT